MAVDCCACVLNGGSCAANVKLVERGNKWAGLLGAAGNVRFEVANATVSLQHILGGTSPYPGPLSLVTIQFPGAGILSILGPVVAYFIDQCASS